MNVFIVTEGAYSDYCVAAVFTAKDKADEYAELIDGDVKEMKTDTPFVDPGLDYFVVDMKKDGDASCFKHPRLNGVGERHKESVIFRTVEDYPDGMNGILRHPQNYWSLRWEGYAKSEEHAVRSAYELRRQMLAGQRPASVDFGEN